MVLKCVFLFIVNIRLLPPGCGQFGPQGLDWQETTRYCYKLNQQAVGLMAPATTEQIFKVFPIISLRELYVTHGSLSPSYCMCFTLNLIRTDIY